MSPPARVVPHVVQVTPRTQWMFVEVHDADGRVGAGEATLSGQDGPVLEALRRIGAAIMERGRLPAPEHLAEDLPTAAAVSALDQALGDLSAQRQGLTLAGSLGPVQRTVAPLYANINRRTTDRSPAGFAASARLAAAAGFTAIKLAPFDEVPPPPRAAPPNMTPGLARIAAVRAAVDPGCAVMVDCHWRFTPAEAPALADAVAESSVTWLECPVPEVAETIPSLVALRARVNARGMRLAGLEHAVGVAGFLPWLRAGAYDAMMPDVKYVGGLTEMLRIADALAAHGVAFSPHNPTGPICHAMSLHICAVAREVDRLEVQFDETPAFGQLVGGDVPQQSGGVSALPTGVGLGMRLDPAMLDRMR